MEDVTPGLLKAVQKEFKRKLNESSMIASVYQKVRDGTATYAEANDFAIEVGEILASAFQSNLSSDVLPDGRMYYNIAERIIGRMLENNYLLITDVTNQVQEALNKSAQIGMKAIQPELNQDRIDGLVNKASNADSFDDVAWVLDEPIVNFSQSIVDDAIRANAEFQSKAGMSPVISRKIAGNCCEWCRRLAGTYRYPDDVPEDLYRRHQRCRCTVEYNPKDGRGIQNSYTKKWRKTDELKKIEIRKQIGIIETKKLSIQKGRDVTNEYERARYPGQGKVAFDVGYDRELHKEEVDVAQWLYKNMGGNIRLLNESAIDGEKMPDYMWNNKYWELKSTTTEKAANSAIRKGIKQIEGNPGGIILNYNSEIDLQEAINVIEKRMKGSKQGDISIDIMIIQNGKLSIVLRY